MSCIKRSSINRDLALQTWKPYAWERANVARADPTFSLLSCLVSIEERSNGPTMAWTQEGHITYRNDNTEYKDDAHSIYIRQQLYVLLGMQNRAREWEETRHQKIDALLWNICAEAAIWNLYQQNHRFLWNLPKNAITAEILSNALFSEAVSDREFFVEKIYDTICSIENGIEGAKCAAKAIGFEQNLFLGEKNTTDWFDLIHAIHTYSDHSWIELLQQKPVSSRIFPLKQKIYTTKNIENACKDPKTLVATLVALANDIDDGTIENILEILWNVRNFSCGTASGLDFLESGMILAKHNALHKNLHETLLENKHYTAFENLIHMTLDEDERNVSFQQSLEKDPDPRHFCYIKTRDTTHEVEHPLGQLFITPHMDNWYIRDEHKNMVGLLYKTVKDIDFLAFLQDFEKQIPQDRQIRLKTCESLIAALLYFQTENIADQLQKKLYVSFDTKKQKFYGQWNHTPIGGRECQERLKKTLSTYLHDLLGKDRDGWNGNTNIFEFCYTPLSTHQQIAHYQAVEELVGSILEPRTNRISPQNLGTEKVQPSTKEGE